MFPEVMTKLYIWDRAFCLKNLLVEYLHNLKAIKSNLMLMLDII